MLGKTAVCGLLKEPVCFLEQGLRGGVIGRIGEGGQNDDTMVVKLILRDTQWFLLT